MLPVNGCIQPFDLFGRVRFARSAVDFGGAIRRLRGIIRTGPFAIGRVPVLIGRVVVSLGRRFGAGQAADLQPVCIFACAWFVRSAAVGLGCRMRRCQGIVRFRRIAVGWLSGFGGLFGWPVVQIRGVCEGGCRLNFGRFRFGLLRVASVKIRRVDVRRWRGGHLRFNNRHWVHGLGRSSLGFRGRGFDRGKVAGRWLSGGRKVAQCSAGALQIGLNALLFGGQLRSALHFRNRAGKIAFKEKRQANAVAAPCDIRP